jgi:hypothetical protein
MTRGNFDSGFSLAVASSLWLEIGGRYAAASFFGLRRCRRRAAERVFWLFISLSALPGGTPQGAWVQRHAVRPQGLPPRT